MYEDDTQEVIKSKILLRDFAENPACAHGPAVLFERNGKRFFSCSAFRSRKLCPFYLEEETYLKQNANLKKRKMDVSCELGEFLDANTTKFSEHNKGQAQYYFSENCLQFIMKTLNSFNVTNLLCIGAPKIHCGFEGKSHLLDIDEKFDVTPNFSRYNMCNHHFIQGKAEYTNFLKDSKTLTMFCDPPFGARLELLFNTFKLIESDWRTYQSTGTMQVFLVHPYFSEGAIIKLDNSMKMSDYKVQYKTHKKFKNVETSIVRIFTNVDLAKWMLPFVNYKFCVKCRKFVHLISKHCEICQDCDSRDGKAYKHCPACQRCVKEKWIHCLKCNACHFVDNCRV